MLQCSAWGYPKKIDLILGYFETWRGGGGGPKIFGIFQLIFQNQVYTQLFRILG